MTEGNCVKQHNFAVKNVTVNPLLPELCIVYHSPRSVLNTDVNDHIQSKQKFYFMSIDFLKQFSGPNHSMVLLVY